MKFLNWFRKIFHRHDYELYIYYTKYQQLFKCKICEEFMFHDFEEDFSTKHQQTIDSIRKTIIEGLKIKSENGLIESTRKMKENFGDKESLIKYMKGLEREQKQIIK